MKPVTPERLIEWSEGLAEINDNHRCLTRAQQRRARTRLYTKVWSEPCHDDRPTLTAWVKMHVDAATGPFKMDVVRATMVLPCALQAWEWGHIRGSEPSVNQIGWAFYKNGYKTWEPWGLKMWIIRNEERARLLGGKYWMERIRNVEQGGAVEWEPEMEDRELVRRARKALKLRDRAEAAAKEAAFALQQLGTSETAIRLSS